MRGHCSICKMLVLTTKEETARVHKRYEPKLGKLETCPGSGVMVIFEPARARRIEW